jgi:hypothetical protein
MTASVAVLIVHGMGVQQPNFADGMITALKSRLATLGIAEDAIAWRPGYWADILNAREQELWARESAKGDLTWGWLRRPVVNVLADAVAYRREPARGETLPTYTRIHDRIRHHVSELEKQVSPAAPLIIAAHSLGSVIMTDFVWDIQSANGRGHGETPFQRMQTLAGMVTFGSNIPLFTLALPKVECIAFPGDRLTPPVRSAAKWVNFYDPADVLGWPLKPLSDAYAAAVDEDRAIRVGGPLTFWNPASHGEYWTDTNFTRPTAELVAAITRAARSG